MPNGTVLSRLAAALIASAGLALAGCGKTHNTTAQAALPATVPASAAEAPAGSAPMPIADPNAPPVQPVAPPDPCPSIGTLAEAKGPHRLNGGRVIRLTPACSAGDLTAHLRTYGQDMRFILVADDLRAGVQPGALFELRLGPPSGAEAAVIGTINFYSAQRPSSTGQPHSISFDVTGPVQSLAVSGWPSQGLGVAIAPSGPVAPNSDATVGAIRLVAQAPR